MIKTEEMGEFEIGQTHRGFYLYGIRQSTGKSLYWQGRKRGWCNGAIPDGYFKSKDHIFNSVGAVLQLVADKTYRV